VPKPAASLKKLRELKDGLDEDLEFEGSELVAAYNAKKGRAVQLHSQGLVWALRAQAALRYRVDGDRLGFFESAYQGALVYELCNQLIKSGMPHDPNMYSLANTDGFFEGLLTYPRPDLRRLLRFMPSEMRNEDPAIKFLFVVFLAELVAGLREDYEETVRVLRGEAAKGAEADIEIRLCESLQTRNAALFTDAMQGYLDRRLNEIAENENVRLGEDQISFEGLGLRRLAADVGIDVQVRHKLMPIDLQQDYPDPTTFARAAVPDVGTDYERPGFWDGAPPAKRRR
jgi:hypothetical protein